MTSRVRTITVDCTDHEKLAAFWSAAIGYDEDPDNPNTPGDPESLLIPRDGKGPALQFIPVPETKAGKNRLHLDIRPTDRTRDEEMDRLLALGATLFDDHRRPDGTGFVVLIDPEGNEFCVERSDEEIQAGPTQHQAPRGIAASSSLV